jgi:predicted homoserine dehydrogenase-like protein
MVGAGYMARGIAFQMLNGFKGMELVALSNRNPDKDERAYREAGADSVITVEFLTWRTLFLRAAIPSQMILPCYKDMRQVTEAEISRHENPQYGI